MRSMLPDPETLRQQNKGYPDERVGGRAMLRHFDYQCHALFYKIVV